MKIIFTKLDQMQLGAVSWVVVAAACAAPISLIALACFWWLLVPIVIFIELFIWPLLFWRKLRALNAQPAIHRPPDGYNPRAIFDRFIHNASSMSQFICLKVGLS
jgi:hypothetical protein